jgi:hypothetical protein
MENDRGTGLAAIVSPAPQPAKEIDQVIHARDRAREEFAAVVVEFVGWDRLRPEDPREDGTAEAEIDAEYRRRLTGLRGLCRGERAQARRAARDWRFLARKALREKRAAERRARHALRLSRMPPPRQPG